MFVCESKFMGKCLNSWVDLSKNYRASGLVQLGLQTNPNNKYNVSYVKNLIEIALYIALIVIVCIAVVFHRRQDSLYKSALYLRIGDFVVSFSVCK